MSVLRLAVALGSLIGAPDAPEWLGPLRPDRLAEQLIVGELTSYPELIVSLFTGLAEARGVPALTVLARAALTDDRAVSLIRRPLPRTLTTSLSRQSRWRWRPIPSWVNC